jgi:hypothetical protein
MPLSPLRNRESELLALVPASFDEDGDTASLLGFTRSTRVVPTGRRPSTLMQAASVGGDSEAQGSKDRGGASQPEPVLPSGPHGKVPRHGSTGSAATTGTGTNCRNRGSLVDSATASRLGGVGTAPPTQDVPILLLDRRVVEATRGVPSQVFHQVRAVFFDMMRRHHVVLSIFMANGEAQLPLTLSQRVLVSAV